jgi:hypothetical protein
MDEGFGRREYAVGGGIIKAGLDGTGFCLLEELNEMKLICNLFLEPLCDVLMC